MKQERVRHNIWKGALQTGREQHSIWKGALADGRAGSAFGPARRMAELVARLGQLGHMSSWTVYF